MKEHDCQGESERSDAIAIDGSTRLQRLAPQPLQPRGILQLEADYRKGEGEGAERVATREPTWLSRKPEQPFHSRPSHPLGRPRHRLGEEIEQSADADRQLAVQSIAMRVHEQFLAWIAHGDEQHIGRMIGDFSDDVGFFRCRKIAVMKADDTMPWIKRLDLGRHALDDIGLRAEEINSQASFAGRQKLRNEIRSIQIAGEGCPCRELRGDVERDAVVEDQHVRQSFAEAHVEERIARSMRIAECDLSMVLPIENGFDVPQRLVDGQMLDADWTEFEYALHPKTSRDTISISREEEALSSPRMSKHPKVQYILGFSMRSEINAI
ncbi:MULTISPECIES: hypothetical protein [Methylosinus]|uniref:hypothetical protein n=1 Tax=Methylosinus sp. 3S-1 TaxID=1849840 RepID=UPI001FCCA39F|nr:MULTISPECIES: hypothetical protein [Methylosinus]